VTLQALLVESERLGVRLEVHDARLRYEAPAGFVTPALKAALSTAKPELIEVLWRLDEMRRLAGEAPRAVVYAREAARGGPGRCFSCGDALEHPAAYGRCVPCDVASDVFYSSQSSGEREEVVI
jgi:hypothetical protein